MKRLMLFCLIGAFVLTSTVVSAQEKASFGPGNLAVKVDYLQFTDDKWAEAGDDDGLDSALYVGIEAFAETLPNLYLGFEVGWTNPDSTKVRDTELFEYEITYVPIEANLKYAVALGPKLYLGFGGGVSYNWGELEARWVSRNDSRTKENWVFGGQIFVDLNYKFDMFFLGFNAKYQMTEKWGEDLMAPDLSNWRIGGQIGLTF